jgi:hypothetical protein
MPPPADDPARRRRLNIAIGMLVAALLAGGLLWSVFAQRPRSIATEVQGAPVFDAEWVKLPTPKDVEGAYPPKAKAAQFREQVLVDMRCVITGAGTLTGCAIFHENIPGWGFGEAALALSDRFALKTQARDGSSLVGLVVTVPLGFDPIFAPSPPPKPASGAIT